MSRSLRERCSGRSSAGEHPASCREHKQEAAIAQRRTAVKKKPESAPRVAPVAGRAQELAVAYAAAYAVALKANGESGNAHFAALKAMELAIIR